MNTFIKEGERLPTATEIVREKDTRYMTHEDGGTRLKAGKPKRNSG